MIIDFPSWFVAITKCLIHSVVKSKSLAESNVLTATGLFVNECIAGGQDRTGEGTGDPSL